MVRPSPPPRRFAFRPAAPAAALTLLLLAVGACSSRAQLREEPAPPADSARLAAAAARNNDAASGRAEGGAPGSGGEPTADRRAREAALEAQFFAAQIEEKRRVDEIFSLVLGREMIVRKVGYQSSDGLTIPAYFFAPFDTTVRRPTILFAHGGVHGDFGLVHLRQVRDLVRQGYVVVAPDFRGSTGYGARFFSAIDYGGMEVDDVVAARDYLARQAPYADLGRLGVMGYSHGGYIALLAVIRNPKLFKVAVAHVPVADLPTRMRTHPAWYEALFVAQPAYGAPLAVNPGPYVERSPSAHARALRTPVLVHAADNDDDVFIAENHVLRDSMVAAGADRAGLYTYREWHDPPGGHGFGIMDTSEGRESWAETRAFLARHLNPAGVAVPNAGATPAAPPSAEGKAVATPDTATVTLRAGTLLDGRGGAARDAMVTVSGGWIGDPADEGPGCAKLAVYSETNP